MSNHEGEPSGINPEESREVGWFLGAIARLVKDQQARNREMFGNLALWLQSVRSTIDSFEQRTTKDTTTDKIDEA